MSDMESIRGILERSLGENTPEIKERNIMSNGLKIFGIGFALFFTLLFLMSSWYTVPEGYRGVITRNGAVVGVAETGLGWKIPLIDSVYDMSVQTQKVAWKDDKNRGILSVYSRDIQQAQVLVSVNYRLLPDKVAYMYSTVGRDYASTILYPLVEQRMKEVFGQFSAIDLVARRELIASRSKEALAKDVESRGLIIESLQIENIDFSDSYEKSAELVAQNEAEVRQSMQKLEREKVDAERQVVQATAAAKATRERADAEAYQTRVRGDAEASAIKARADALKANAALVDLMSVEKWDGKLPIQMVPQGTLPFLHLNK